MVDTFSPIQQNCEGFDSRGGEVPVEKVFGVWCREVADMYNLPDDMYHAFGASARIGDQYAI